MKMDETRPAGAGMDMGSAKAPPSPPLPVMALVSFAVLAAGLVIAWIFGGL